MYFISEFLLGHWSSAHSKENNAQLPMINFLFKNITVYLKYYMEVLRAFGGSIIKFKYCHK